MKVGAEPKKIAALGLLAAVAGVLIYQQFISGPSSPAAAAPTRSPQPATRQGRSAADEILENRSGPKTKNLRVSNEFKPSLKKSKPGEGPDPVKLDPTLRIDLLEKVRAVEYEKAERNLFLFGAATPKLTPQQIEEQKRAAGTPAAPPKPADPPPPSKPTAPPITLKYYGNASRPGEARKRAFLIDGDEIYVAVEGELIKKRFKVVRIGVNSIVMEDVEFQDQQTLPLQES